MINVYVAGPLFNEADMAQRIREGVALRNALDHIPEIGGYEVFNPIESDVNFKVASPTAAEIFNIDNTFIQKTTHFFFDIANLDQGVFVELGQALQLKENGTDVKIYAVHSDIRMPKAGDYVERHVPVGTNQYMIGALDYHGIKVYHTFKEALNQFILDVH